MTAPAPVRPSGSAPVTRAGHRSRFSSVAAKYIMAITGLIFSAYVLVHMIGNLKVYQGPEAFNSYAHWLRNAFYPVLPYEGLLWILRVVLLVSVLAHIVCALILKARARRARGGARAPSIRRRRGLGLSVFAGRSMLVTGVVLLLFVIFH
ncbi:MAG: succinate dehydrogenase, partial [Kocuria sp.]|nr:succinate dehydrogenase [Kocuria sp.]